MRRDRRPQAKSLAASRPEPPVEGPRPTDQINLTDEESHIMPISGGGFEQCYNAQAVVAEGSLLVVASDVIQAANDKQQLEPMLAKTGALPEELGRADTMLADNGYFSGANVKACIAAASSSPCSASASFCCADWERSKQSGRLSPWPGT